MLTSSDIIRLPYTPDLTEGGIAYACRSLPHTYDRMGGSSFERMRRIAVGISVELAFRRYLTGQGIPFDVRGATPFTDPDHYDVSLSGRRCDLKTFLISRREQISALHAHPESLLKAPALFPLDQFVADGRAANELLVFAFMTGLVAASAAESSKALDAGQPAYMVYAMPGAWVRPQLWAPLGVLSFKSESDMPLGLEIGGQDYTREFMMYTAHLEPHARVDVVNDLYSLAYVHASSLPQGRLSIHASIRDEAQVIRSGDWGNVWVYGMRIFLAGWAERDEFRRKSELIREGSRVFQYDRTRTKNLAVPVEELRPISELLSRAGEWAKDR